MKNIHPSKSIVVIGFKTKRGGKKFKSLLIKMYENYDLPNALLDVLDKELVEIESSN